MSQDDRALTTALRATRWGDPATEERHPGSEALAAYHDGELGSEEADQLRDHLASCASCRQILLDLAGYPFHRDGNDGEGWQRLWSRLGTHVPTPGPSSPIAGWVYAAAVLLVLIVGGAATLLLQHSRLRHELAAHEIDLADARQELDIARARALELQAAVGGRPLDSSVAPRKGVLAAITAVLHTNVRGVDKPTVRVGDGSAAIVLTLLPPTLVPLPEYWIRLETPEGAAIAEPIASTPSADGSFTVVLDPLKIKAGKYVLALEGAGEQGRERLAKFEVSLVFDG